VRLSHNATPEAASRSGLAPSPTTNTMTSVAPLLPSNTPTRAPHRLAVTATSPLHFFMADSPASPPPAAAETPAQEKARLRRERLAAKLATGGATRLQQISALQGGPPKDLSEIQKDLPGTIPLLHPIDSTTRPAANCMSSQARPRRTSCIRDRNA
jgi:hypothetical protein